MNEYDDWADIIDELDAHAELKYKDQDFIISLKEDKPRHLSPKQIKWLEDLKERYLV